MNDWYTDAVKRALEVVPVEWVGLQRIRKRLRCDEGDGDDMFYEDWYVPGADKWVPVGNSSSTDPHTAQALIEKAFREWLDAKTDGNSVSGSYEKSWNFWTYRDGESVFLARAEPSYLEAQATAVLFVEAKHNLTPGRSCGIIQTE